MRLLLDAHLSGRRLGSALRDRGHDVLCVDEDPLVRDASDEELMVSAASEERILVTCNVGDFARLGTAWAERGRGHPGCILLVGIDHREFGLILRRLEAAFSERPDPERWRDQFFFVGREGG